MLPNDDVENVVIFFWKFRPDEININTLMSGINDPGRKLILWKIALGSVLFDTWSLIYFWEIAMKVTNMIKKIFTKVGFGGCNSGRPSQSTENGNEHLANPLLDSS